MMHSTSQALSILALSIFGVLTGTLGFIMYRPGLAFRGYLAGKWLFGSGFIGIGTAFIIAHEYGLLRAVLHVFLYAGLIALGTLTYKKLDSKQQ